MTHPDRCTHDLLRRARAIIAAPDHWTQRTQARDRNGDPCDPCASRATAWCLTGAILLAMQPSTPLLSRMSQYGRAVAALEQAVPDGCSDIQLWNDRRVRTHADVLNTMDAAIDATRGD